MIVADTNLLVYFAMSTSLSKDAQRVRAKDRNWTAPSLLRSEFMNVISKACRENHVSRDAALRSFRRGMNLVNISKLHSDPLFIFNAAQTTGCSSYDLEFVWLAMELGIQLVTADQQVLRAFPMVAIDLANFLK
jgi:predicted nucleic acid-binding protein